MTWGDFAWSPASEISALSIPRELGLNATLSVQMECGSISVLVQFCAGMKSGLLDETSSSSIPTLVELTSLIGLNTPSVCGTAGPN